MVYFTSWLAFIHMGGYAFYVWTAYFLAFLVLGSNAIYSFIKLKKTIKQLRQSHANQT